MRLIDADALIDDLKHDVAVDQDSLDYEELTDSNRENIQFDKDCKQNAIDLLQHAPTIEPRCETCEAFNKTRLLIQQPQRKKGKWIYLDKDKRFFHPHIVKCSVCNNTLDMYGVNAGRGDANFCPNCGASMSEGEEHEDD